MKFNELMAAVCAPQDGDQMLNILKTIMMADDLTAQEMAAVACGFMIGSSFVLAKFTEGHPEEAAIGVLQMMQQWETTIFKNRK